MTTSPDDGAGPASLAEQVTAALDVSEEILTVLEDVQRRLEALEETRQRGGGVEARGDFRFEHYPAAATDADQAAQLERARAAWQRLDGWVGWLVATYKLTTLIPPCWPEHPTLREELIGLRVAWTGAWSPRASHDAIQIFHEKAWNTRHRLLDGNYGNPRCPGHHDHTGLDLADHYHAWANDPRHDRALITARDRSLATVRATWTTSSGGER